MSDPVHFISPEVALCFVINAMGAAMEKFAVQCDLHFFKELICYVTAD